jgi:DNA-binding HxlR family transcriptional regulator
MKASARSHRKRNRRWLCPSAPSATTAQARWRTRLTIVGGMGNEDTPSHGLASMASEPVAPRDCSIADALSVLGERWTFLAIREMVYGAHRFDQIAGFTGATRDILVDRLRKLEEHGVIERRQYSERPPRYEYHLTESGQQLVPVLLALATWGHNWASGPTPPRGFLHQCGQPLQIDHICHACGEEVTADAIEPMSDAVPN